MEPWQVGLALGFTALALFYIGRVAKDVRHFRKGGGFHSHNTGNECTCSGLHETCTYNY